MDVELRRTPGPAHWLAKKYMRTEAMPHLFCPGCGNGMIQRAILMALNELGEEVWRRTVFVSGIGCSGWIPMFFRRGCIHALHGRAIAFATGIKLARPELNVMVITGDGDTAAIGGNHLIHAARRNIGLRVIMVNNMVYGMTGGQVAPTTPPGMKTSTTPYGNIEPSFDLMKLLEAAGAAYLARWATPFIYQLKNSIKKAIGVKGFAFIEVVSQCPTYFGRYYLGTADPYTVFTWIKEHCIPLSAAEKMSEGELRGKIIVGEFLHREDRPEFSTLLHEKVREISGAK